MSRYVLAVDLGTTNIKFALYDEQLHEICTETCKVRYLYEHGYVEFDSAEYWEACRAGIAKVLKTSAIDAKQVACISLTGQAESLVVLDGKGSPLRNGISWLDERSTRECAELREYFDVDQGYRITGLPDIVPTWPATKIQWLRRNEPQVYNAADKYLLLKDYIAYKLTGKLAGDLTVYNFSFYLDIVHKRFWADMLDFLGVRPEQLPDLIEPGRNAGRVIRDLASDLGLSDHVQVNIGTLDHFAGMIGSGNIQRGLVSESTGTVLAIATLVNEPVMDHHRLPCHYGMLPDTYVLLPVCESGGISLEWFKNTFLPDRGWDSINEQIGRVLFEREDLVFLPYIIGSNSPEFDPNARGVFYGIRHSHTAAHFAKAVMEGVTFLLRKNIEVLRSMGIRASEVLSVGGGAKSPVWNQMKADVTATEVLIPEQEEPVCLGAAVLGFAGCGVFDGIDGPVRRLVRVKKRYVPENSVFYEEPYRVFLRVYEQLEPVFALGIKS